MDSIIEEPLDLTQAVRAKTREILVPLLIEVERGQHTPDWALSYSTARVYDYFNEQGFIPSEAWNAVDHWEMAQEVIHSAGHRTTL